MVHKGSIDPTQSIDRALSKYQTFTYYYKRADDWVLEMEFDTYKHFCMQIISPVMEATPEHNHYLKYLK
uniref:Uncharacterized protein n=1 Tax=Acrobeloides nanus TaxID=290746 RepID=A0A914CTZ5_9BILA